MGLTADPRLLASLSPLSACRSIAMACDFSFWAILSSFSSLDLMDSAEESCCLSEFTSPDVAAGLVVPRRGVEIK